MAVPYRAIGGRIRGYSSRDLRPPQLTSLLTCSRPALQFHSPIPGAVRHVANDPVQRTPATRSRRVPRSPSLPTHHRRRRAPRLTGTACGRHSSNRQGTSGSSASGDDQGHGPKTERRAPRSCGRATLSSAGRDRPREAGLAAEVRFQSGAARAASRGVDHRSPELRDCEPAASAGSVRRCRSHQAHRRIGLVGCWGRSRMRRIMPIRSIQQR